MLLNYVKVDVKIFFHWKRLGRSRKLIKKCRKYLEPPHVEVLKIYYIVELKGTNNLDRHQYYFSSIPLGSGSHTQPIFINEGSKEREFHGDLTNSTLTLKIWMIFFKKKTHPNIHVKCNPHHMSTYIRK